MKLLIISSSPRDSQKSKTYKLASAIKDISTKQSIAQVDLWDLAEKPLPKAEPQWHYDPSSNKNPLTVQNFAKAIDSADAVVLCTPTYHGSYSGLLKNALDCMGENQFLQKHIIIASHGWSQTAMMPCMHLQDVARTMGGNVYRRFIVAETGELDSSQLSEKARTRISEILSDVA